MACSGSRPGPGILSWGDVAVIRDCSSAQQEPMHFMRMMGEGVLVPSAISLDSGDESSSSDESTSEESLEDYIGESTSLYSPLLDHQAMISTHLCASSKGTESTNVSMRTVTFSTIQVREYALTLGTRSMISNIMYPLSLDWDFVETAPQAVDDYESVRQQERGKSTTTHKCRAPRLSVTERMLRLAKVMGRTRRDLFGEERKRQLQVTEDNRKAAIDMGSVRF